MEAYVNLLLYAIPFFILLVLAEQAAAMWQGVQVNRGPDTVASLSSGVTNVIKDVLGLSIVIISYAWLVDKIALTHLPTTWWVYVIGFVVIDFAGYWMHRLSHSVNLFWNRHIIHHSSEEYNMACALRQSISETFSFVAIFMIPAALLGVESKVIATIAPIHLFAQFWYHTRLIDKMGWLEKVIMTPSHHRVHHAMNTEYLDKNFSPIFIWWDKWFGTFQEELKEVPPVYGVKRPVKTWNPIHINFQHFWLLVKDAWRSKNWIDKLKIWWMPTGWRPEDVARLYPVESVSDMESFEKYRTHNHIATVLWAWIQLLLLLVLMFHLFLHLADYSLLEILSYGAMLFLFVYGYTSLLDQSIGAVVAKTIFCGLGLAIIGLQGDWFGLSEVLPYGKYWMTAFFILSWVTTCGLYLVEKDRKQRFEMVQL